MALTTHILDTSLGRPAAGVSLELFEQIDGVNKFITTAVTNSDGRCDNALLSHDNIHAGVYEIRFLVGDYFDSIGQMDRFYDNVTIQFRIKDEKQHYHVPLLLNPFGYSTYRGS